MEFESNRHRRSTKCHRMTVPLLRAFNINNSNTTTKRDTSRTAINEAQEVLPTPVEEAVEVAEGTESTMTTLHPLINNILVFYS